MSSSTHYRRPPVEYNAFVGQWLAATSVVAVRRDC